MLPVSDTSLLTVYTFHLFITVKWHLKKGRIAANHQSLPDSWNLAFLPPAERPESEQHSTAPHWNTQPGQQLRNTGCFCQTAGGGSPLLIYLLMATLGLEKEFLVCIRLGEYIRRTFKANTHLRTLLEGNM